MEYVRILHLAASTLEARVERALSQLLLTGRSFDYATVQEYTPTPITQRQSRHIEYRTQPLDGNGVTWYHVEKCPFHYDECHPFECGVGQKLPDGPYAGKCFHAETEPRGWQEWKVALGLTFSTNGQSLNPKDKNGPFPLTDAGNAELFAALYGHILRFDHARNRWLIWEEHRWAPDSDGGPGSSG